MTGRRAGRGERAGAIAAVATAVVVTGVGVGALVAGSGEGWVVLAIGWGVCVPLAAGTGVLVASTIEAGFDAVLTVGSALNDREVGVAESGDKEPGDADRSRVGDPDLGRSRHS